MMMSDTLRWYAPTDDRPTVAWPLFGTSRVFREPKFLSFVDANCSLQALIVVALFFGRSQDSNEIFSLGQLSPVSETSFNDGQ